MSEKKVVLGTTLLGGLVGTIGGQVAGLNNTERYPTYERTVEEVATQHVADEPDAAKLTPAEVAVHVAVEKAKEERDRAKASGKISERNNAVFGKSMAAGAGIGAGTVAAGWGLAALLGRRRRRDEDEVSPERAR